MPLVRQPILSLRSEILSQIPDPHDTTDHSGLSAARQNQLSSAPLQSAVYTLNTSRLGKPFITAFFGRRAAQEAPATSCPESSGKRVGRRLATGNWQLSSEPLGALEFARVSIRRTTMRPMMISSGAQFHGSLDPPSRSSSLLTRLDAAQTERQRGLFISLGLAETRTRWLRCLPAELGVRKQSIIFHRSLSRFRAICYLLFAICHFPFAICHLHVGDSAESGTHYPAEQIRYSCSDRAACLSPARQPFVGFRRAAPVATEKQKQKEEIILINELK